jgi:hypothetical protein
MGLITQYLSFTQDGLIGQILIIPLTWQQLPLALFVF